MSLRKITSLFAASAALAIAAPAHAEWAEAKSKHFTVYGDMKESDLRERIEKLEKFDAVLRGIFKIKEDDHGTIYYTNSVGDLQKLAGSNRVLGFYRSSAQGPIGFVPEKGGNTPNFVGSSMSSDRILFHEYTHHITLSLTSQAFPAWAVEGLGELFMTVKYDDKGNVIIGQNNPARQSSISSMSRWSVRKLLEDGTYRPKGDSGIELYSKGWALCHYLILGGKRDGQFFQYILEMNGGLTPLQAGEKVFGNLDKLDQEVERYIRQATLPSAQFDGSKFAVSKEIAIRRLSQGEAEMMPFRMVSANGVNNQTAGPLAERARPVAAKYPTDALVQRAMAEIEYDAKNYDRASAAADAALAADSKNLMAMIYKGRIAMQRAIANKNDPALVREARRWFLAANKADPDYPLPFVLFYDSFIAVGQTPPASAVTGLNRAAYLIPADPELRVKTGLAAIRAGDLKMARFTLAAFAFNPNVADSESPVSKLLKEIVAGASQEALLKKMTELKLDKVNEFTVPDPEESGKDGKGGKDDAKKDDKAKS